MEVWPPLSRLARLVDDELLLERAAKNAPDDLSAAPHGRYRASSGA